MTARARSASWGGLRGHWRDRFDQPGATISDGRIPGANRAQLPGAGGDAIPGFSKRGVWWRDFPSDAGLTQRVQGHASGGGYGFQTNGGVKFSGHDILVRMVDRVGRGDFVTIQNDVSPLQIVIQSSHRAHTEQCV